MGIERKSLSIIRLIVFQTTRETNALHSMNSAMRNVLSIIVEPQFIISLNLSKPIGILSPAKIVAVPSMKRKEKGYRDMRI
ncbi:hypothetical protein RIR_jg4528.t1 [Rhizophagus irregularis DAOM 181602=DAOM 197198]|nr:hypothetical protein RIR_jg4528.t1 [Rhizophagus irregularis DAOM 181602=DAOM 197198]